MRWHVCLPPHPDPGLVFPFAMSKSSADGVAPFREFFAKVAEMPRVSPTTVVAFEHMGTAGKDIRLFIHNGLRGRLYQPDSVEPFNGQPLDATRTFSLCLATDHEENDYTFVVGFGEGEVTVARRIAVRGHPRCVWRFLNGSEVRALAIVAGGNLSCSREIRDAEPSNPAVNATSDMLPMVLSIVTAQTAGEAEILGVRRVLTAAKVTPAPPKRRHGGMIGTSAALIVAFLVSMAPTPVTSSASRSQPIRIVEALDFQPAATQAPVANPATTLPVTTESLVPPATIATAVGAVRGTVERTGSAGLRASTPIIVSRPPPQLPPTTYVPAVQGLHWPCTPNPDLEVDIDPRGASATDLANYISALRAAASDTNRQIVIVYASLPVATAMMSGTIYVAWHPINGVPQTTALHPAWTALFFDYPAQPDHGESPEILSAATVFTPGLPRFVAYHETGREFGLGDSPYSTDDGFGGNFAVAGVPWNQTFSPGDLAGLRAGAPSC
jgi:hypothetical protein